MKIRGIPTVYNSQRFRSLTEARWASFFDNAWVILGCADVVWLLLTRALDELGAGS